ncbi:hypothetical protein NCC49_001364 [Naganishia albida]|nr:hypothetical protein NCC49_001364 [Naganishia albida]
MEKFSKWRDPGTGIQPFLPPVPAQTGASLQLYAYKGVAALASISRCAILALVTVAHVILVGIPEKVLGPGSSWKLTRIPNALLCRFALFLMGYWWIATEVVQVKRVRGTQTVKVDAKPGDVIVTNWTGYVDLLYLAFRFNPTFLLPIHHSSSPSSGTTTPLRAEFKGYAAVNLTTALSLTGHTPITFSNTIPHTEIYPTIVLARLACDGRPLVVFPEGTTSNARGLLRFSQGCLGDVEVPVRGSNVWVMFFKHPSPTSYTPTATHSVPNNSFNPLPHIANTITQSLLPRQLNVRILHPHNSPSSGSFLPSETLDLATTASNQNVMGECCAVLLRQLGRVKSVGLGWEDKDGFLVFLRERRPVGAMGMGSARKVAKGRVR